MRYTNKEIIFGETRYLIDDIYATEKTMKMAVKLGQLEDVEDELGIDLVILFKALSCGAWEKQKDNVLNFDDCKLLYKRIQIGSNVHWLSNYGKTWALTKEELL